MSNIHRIRWIDQQIRGRVYPNCANIAEQFEISIRQASRDIEYLRFSLDAPLTYSYDHKGYYYVDGAFSLPSLFISKEDRDALSCLANQYRHEDSDQANRLAELFLHLSGEKMGEESKILPNSTTPLHPGLIKTYHILHRAMQQGAKIQLKYISSSNDLTARIIHPYQWLHSFGRQYVVAFCESRADFRLFRLDRIRRIHALEEKFTPAPDFQPNRFTSMNSRFFFKPYTAIIQWNKAIAIPSSFTWAYEQGENHCCKISFTSSSSLFVSLIALMEPFCIIQPKWLKEQYCLFIKRFSGQIS